LIVMRRFQDFGHVVVNLAHEVVWLAGDDGVRLDLGVGCLRVIRIRSKSYPGD
jgi:hypothetical protein